jgi:hypothetical protein
MANDFVVRLECPYGDRDQVVTLEGRKETLPQILDTPWDFECPVHGLQKEIPVEGSEKQLWKGAKLARKAADPTAGISAQSATKAARPAKTPSPRASNRISLHVPVVVYGWSKSDGSFHEETSTILINASGSLVPLAARIGLGDTVFLVNKETQREQECRVAFLGTDAKGKQRAGVAFVQPVPNFWRTARREARIAKTIPVSVKGVDRGGNSYVQSAQALDVSRHGARLVGVGFVTWPGETIVVKRRWRSASFRVLWVGEAGSPEADQAGLFALEPNKSIWGVEFP